MNDFLVRPVREGEERACHAILARALHHPPLDDEQWERTKPSWPADRKIAAFDGGTPIGIASSFSTRMRVPGGALVPVGAVDGIAVRADRTRRGVLTALQARQLADLRERGDIAAYLHASEATIYGRFGYGVATIGSTFRINTHRARLRDTAPADDGSVRLLDGEEATKRIPEVYQRIAPARPGMIARPPIWWPHNFDRQALADHVRVAVHIGPDGDDGFVTYGTLNRYSAADPDSGTMLTVRDLHAGTPAATVALWRYLLGVDLVDEVVALQRPDDDMLTQCLTDPRAARTTERDDATWLRLLDVPAALATRAYGTWGTNVPAVALDVVDEHLPENSGVYVLSRDGAEHAVTTPHLRLGVETLGMLYLGAWAPSRLALAGRIEVLDPDAPARADELFRTPEAPWCGTHF
jgi:predicted acetyltransferase